MLFWTKKAKIQMDPIFIGKNFDESDFLQKNVQKIIKNQGICKKKRSKIPDELKKNSDEFFF